jgi:hypothetical protein
MWCVPELNREYVDRMEDVLNLMERPASEKEPVVALDERPVQLHAFERDGRPMAPGRIARRDYEYVRHGTANIFCIVAPKTGRHLTHATANRKARRFAAAMKRISDAYPNAKRIHIILDNLNTHRLKSLTDAFGDAEGRQLWRRFVVHHTPKHGSWLNPAEIEVSLWSRECIGPRSDRDALRAQVPHAPLEQVRRPLAQEDQLAIHDDGRPPSLPISPRHYAWAEGLVRPATSARRDQVQKLGKCRCVESRSRILREETRDERQRLARE